MKCLFIHYNFPANFRNLVLHLVDKKCDILFVSEYSRRDMVIPEVRHIQIRMAPFQQRANLAEHAALSMLKRAESCGNILLKLKNKGYTPDIIYYHAGFGHGTFLSDIFPSTPRIAHFEWYHDMFASHAFFSQGKVRPPSEFARYHMRNMFQVDALATCSLGIVPTEWQKKSFPANFSDKMHVVHDGVDTSFFHPLQSPDVVEVSGLPLDRYKEVVTYAARTLENDSGFSQFYRSIPAILAARPQAHVVVMTHNTSRSGNVAPTEASWLEAVAHEMPLDTERVHFVGFKSLNEYRYILQKSSLHVHLAPPFGLANSLLEAMSTGALVVASDTMPISGLIKHGVNGFLTDFWDHTALAQLAVWALSRADLFDAQRKAARQTVCEYFDTSLALPEHMKLMKHALGAASVAKLV